MNGSWNDNSVKDYFKYLSLYGKKKTEKLLIKIHIFDARPSFPKTPSPVLFPPVSFTTALLTS